MVVVCKHFLLLNKLQISYSVEIFVVSEIIRLPILNLLFKNKQFDHCDFFEMCFRFAFHESRVSMKLAVRMGMFILFRGALNVKIGL